MPAQTETNTRSAIGTIGLVLSVLIGACIVYYYAWSLLRGRGDTSTLGQVGDAMGPLTGLVSTLALAAAIWSVYIQRNELELQREELRLIRKEHEESREVLRKQEEAQTRQADLLQASNDLMGKSNSVAEKLNSTYGLLVAATRQANIVSLLVEENRTTMESIVAQEQLRNLGNSGGPFATESIKHIRETTDARLKVLSEPTQRLERQG